jgi:hypothetical protein
MRLATALDLTKLRRRLERRDDHAVEADPNGPGDVTGTPRADDSTPGDGPGGCAQRPS